MNKDIDKLERELGIAKKRIETLEKQLKEEQAKGAAYEQLQDINLAMITAIVRSLGEVELKQDDINECLSQHIMTEVSYDAETKTHTLRVAK